MRTSLFRSFRFWLFAGSLAGLFGLFGLLSYNTSQALRSFALENTRTFIAQISETLNLAVVHNTTADNLATLQDYLNELMVGDENGIIYLALLDEKGQFLARSRSTPEPLPSADTDLARQIDEKVVNVRQPILFADNRIGELRYGLSTRQLHAANARAIADNLKLLIGALAITIVVLLAGGLWLSRQIGRLVKASQALAAGDFSHRAPASGSAEFAVLANNFNRMAAAVSERTTALQESDQRFRSLFESSPDPTWIIDKYHFVECNQAAVAMFHLPAKEAFLNIHPSAISPESQPDGESSLVKAERMMNRALEQGLNRFEWLHQRADGSTFFAEVTLSPFTLQDRPVIHAVVRDINDRKLAERELATYRQHLEKLVVERTSELKASRHQLEAIIDNLPAIFFSKDSDGRHLMVNRRFEEGVGVTKEQAIGHTDQEIFPAATADLITQIDRHVLAEKRPITFEERIPHPDGTLHDYLTTKVPLIDDQGQARTLIGIATDISVIKRAEALSEQSMQEAKRLARMKSEFLANMSHEIRTPLNAVLGMARIGARDSSSPASRANFGRILDAGEHLLGVINDILDYSKIEAGKFSVESMPFRLTAIIANASNLIMGIAREKRLSYAVKQTADLPDWVMGDAHRLQQVLVNLLSNAVKFTEHGRVNMTVQPAGAQIRFVIDDEGIGMTPEEVSRLFQPFEQADSSTTRRFGGTGLGLAVSIKLAQLMGGAIEVESTPGRGSIFTLLLPLPETAAPTQAETASKANTDGGPSLAGLRILAAEDVEVNRYILDDMLGEAGASHVFAENGRDAVEQVEADPTAFDVVLMDVQMPVMDGHEATRRIHAFAPTLPVIGLTAHALAEERDKCLAAGMVGHVVKPIDNAALITAILRCARPRGAAPVAPPPAPEPDAVPPAPTFAAATHAQREIDWTQFARRYSGKATLMRKLVQMTLDNYMDTPEKLRQLAEASDFEALAFLAHSIKGLAGNLEAGAVQTLASAVEKAGKARETGALVQTQHLAVRFENMLGDLASHLATDPSTNGT